jgi:hypothetical protein
MLAEIKRLASSECCNFFKELNKRHNFCVLQDDTCKFFKGETTCKYFEQAVLPDHEELQDDYFNWQKSKDTEKIGA